MRVKFTIVITMDRNPGPRICNAVLKRMRETSKARLIFLHRCILQAHLVVHLPTRPSPCLMMWLTLGKTHRRRPRCGT